jgi:outer membrane protein insertion porin family
MKTIPRILRISILKCVSASVLLVSHGLAWAQAPGGYGSTMDPYNPNPSYQEAPSYWQGQAPVTGQVPANAQTPTYGQGTTNYPQTGYSANQFPSEQSLPPGEYVSPFGTPMNSAVGESFTEGTPGIPDFSQPYIGPAIREADLVIDGYPGRTGRIMLGGAVNSDAGLTGQITLDERNFDIMRWPTSFRDLFSGTAFRGAGQTFRIEAAPGTDFKRYTASFSNPNLFGYLPYSFSTSGFLYDRRFDDWDEERLGARFSLGYRVSPDLSISVGVGGQNVDIESPRRFNNSTQTTGLDELDQVLGDTELFSGEVRLVHDTRDSIIQAGKGHYLELRYEQAFGDYDYPRFDTEFRQYWQIAERADGTGRQTISYSTRVGFTGEDTPIFENYFAGGYATLRGFDFRGAGPVEAGIAKGGEFQFLNTVEYMFPITADDAFRGVAFCDFGTVEEKVKLETDNFRVAPGLGLRIAIPMLGPAPLAFDFAYPVAKADTDRERIFSFYMSLIR